MVALRKESVDRNATSLLVYLALIRSLSARRAWIEINCDGRRFDFAGSLSARRAWIEMTDDVSTGGKIKSLSARRAWIEI